MPNWYYLLLFHFHPCLSGFEAWSVSYKSWLWLPFPEQKAGRGQGCSTPGCESHVWYTHGTVNPGLKQRWTVLSANSAVEMRFPLRGARQTVGVSHILSHLEKVLQSPSTRALIILLVDLQVIRQYDGLSWRCNTLSPHGLWGKIISLLCTWS